MTVAPPLKAELLRSGWSVEERGEITVTRVSKNKRELEQFTVMLDDRGLGTGNEERGRG